MNKIIKNTFQLLTVVLLLVTAGCKKKEVDLAKAFVKYYGGLKADAGVEVLQTSDGGYVIAGTSNIGTSNADNYDMIVIKTDEHGNEVWHKTFGSANYDECGDLGIMPDGGYILLGTFGITSRNWSLDPFKLEAGKDSTQMVAVRIDALGNTIWQKPYNYSNPSVEVGTFGKSLVVNQDGTCFLGGMVDSTDLSGGNTTPNLDLFALIIDQDGALIKVGGVDMKPLRYGADIEQDYMGDAILAFSSSGMTEYLISSSTTLAGSNTPRLVKCRMNGVALTQNNAPSKTQWTQSPGADKLLTGEQICRTSDNNYMMTGSSGTLPNADFYMFKLNGLSLDDNGIGFLKFYGGDGNDEGVSIIPTNDGGYAILATTNSVVYTGAAEKQNDVLLMKLSGTGDIQWTKVFGGTGNDSASKLIQTQDGGYLVCGTIAFGDDVSNSGASNSITLIKVNDKGEISNLK
ncbi:MAG TPA: hypothetical protein VNB90_11295 [Cytophagaceae bacterium]|nr:hypothetical protein [Cytophagaceae bacterium]